ncbi:hypothetical protein ACFWC9_31565 [Streptomyces goshikiensis]|uniref:hypothetical protein n=1 Tax=Streptomyces goshikiensis TaxID=1942 RepID=UPI0036B7EAA9
MTLPGLAASRRPAPELPVVPVGFRRRAVRRSSASLNSAAAQSCAWSYTSVILKNVPSSRRSVTTR